MKKLKKIILTAKLFFEDYRTIEIKDKKLSAPSGAENALIEELRKSIRASRKNNGGITWRAFSFCLRCYVRFFDPRQFLRWHIVKQTMFVGTSWPECVDALKQDANWRSVWQPLVEEDNFGSPMHDPLVPESSGNKIVHAYHLLQLQKTTGIAFDELNTVVEFGGGYGNMCVLLRRLGFKGEYIIYDLPEFLSLQKFYLGGVGEHATLVSSPVELQKIISRTKSPSLFIGTWSVSESPIHVREQVLPLVDNFDYFLFGYQQVFDAIDNVAYFKEFAHTHATVTWSEIYKKMWNGYYLFGKKK